ncbi:isoleucine--tRNA ligase [Candidatus Dojkabacteria bacterium]|nr:isoleucine--tRNA ligase [Candidatus Dojkabacteria bacterium]
MAKPNHNDQFYKKIDSLSIVQTEEEISKFWESEKSFEKSVNERPENNPYSFLDGPPFVTGIPGPQSLLPRIAKDVIPRYKTMKGYRVRRVWGWDCHGLPIEEKTEKKVGLKNRREIETFGINNFIDACHTYVDEVSSEWKWYVDRIGEWIDFEGAYRTMDEDYMESVIWVFRKLYDKGLIYEGVKTLLYCTRCGTPVSSFEIAMDDSYTDMEDPAITVEFPVTTEGKFKGARILAWTTTPWTMPSNRALVVDPSETYVMFTSKEGSKKYIVAKKRLPHVLGDDPYTVVAEFLGKELIGLSYTAPYDYFKPNENDWKVYSYEGMVHMEEGTGIVHSAPGFGEIDTEMGNHYGLTIMFSVDDAGCFVPEVKDFAGQYVKKADENIIKDLETRDLLFKAEKIIHRYPYCYRCQTPLIQKAQKSWFINVQKLKPQLLENAKKINWANPVFAKQFENNIKAAPDWCISRTRYWATVMPVWRCDKCGEIEVFGSKSEIKERSGQEPKSLHRNGVDHITFKCEKCEGTMRRIPEVLDVWMESGSMPYGQLHYPFENKELFKVTFPADYIVEYVAQIRAWFYCMHVISNAVIGENSFKNVVVTGVMAGTDGRKMSKSLGNYPDPKAVLTNLGGDAMRLYFMGSSIMVGENVDMNEEELRNQVKTVLFPLRNTIKYLQIYAELHNWKPSSSKINPGESNLLDRWIVARTKRFQTEVEGGLESYNIPSATKAIAPYLDDLSTWYIRRSRDRFAAGDVDALSTLYWALVKFIRLTAPIIPFATESAYEALVKSVDKTALTSVHLELYPKAEILTKEDEALMDQMELLRSFATTGQMIRVTNNIPLKQPLQTLYVDTVLDNGLIDILKDELNVKDVLEATKAPSDLALEEVKVKSGKEFVTHMLGLDLKISEELKKERLLAELARQIQVTRKESGCNQADFVSLALHTKDDTIQKLVEANLSELKEKTKLSSLEFKENSGKELKVGEYKVTLRILK